MPGCPWPELPYASWAPTKKTLQMVLQMMGKLKLALLPPQPEWLHASLQLTPTGWSTGSLPLADGRLLEATVDIDGDIGTLAIHTSDGRGGNYIVLGSKSVANVWAWFSAELVALGVTADIWEKPQELSDTTLFSANGHDATFVAEDVQRFHEVLSAIQGIFEEFRSPFFGRSGIQFWWGAFDLAVLLFNGKHAVAPQDKGYIMRYDLDAEHLNAGFWPGDDSSPDPVFYAYLVPQPPGCALAKMDPGGAAWIEQMGEWILPYEAVRNAPDPAAQVRAFLASAYRMAGELSGWDLESLTYEKPLASERA